MKQMTLFMRYAFFIFYLLLLQVAVEAQETGIKFESGLSWQDVKAKARRENKLIFMDCFATWCGPCILMDRKIYSQKEVGDYFNTHFINVKVQMDRTPMDTETVRSWYSDADTVSRQFRVGAYPTFLFFSSEGEPINKIVGAVYTGNEFVAKAAASLEVENQYFTLLANWRRHLRDSSYLLHTLLAAIGAADKDNARTIANYYVECLKDPLVKYNIDLISPCITSESDKSFQLFLNNAAEINRIIGREGFVETELCAIIFKEEIASLFNNKDTSFDLRQICADKEAKYPTLNKELFGNQLQAWCQNVIDKEIDRLIQGKQLDTKDWAKISGALRKRFREFDFEYVVLGAETRYYFKANSWDQCARAAISLIDQYSEKLGDTRVNDIIWKYVFLHSWDKRVLRDAIERMEKVIRGAPNNTAHLDTYANLLYKTGHKPAAITWENKAISIAEKSINRQEVLELENTLKKMQANAITWENASGQFE